MLSTKDSVMAYYHIGDVVAHSVCLDLLSWLGSKELDLSLAEPDRVPRSGFRVGWVSDDSGSDRDEVAIDACQVEQSDSCEERTRIMRFQLARHEALALANLILAAAR